MASQIRASSNPRKWRFTWEATSHKSTLSLFLFDFNTKPSEQCKDLSVDLILQQFHLLVSWIQDDRVSLRVPIPRVLVDSESPPSFRALEDHIEVKLLLLLPVDHPIVSDFGSLLNDLGDGSLHEDPLSNEVKPLCVDYDLKSLCSKEEVHLYCRHCSAILTKNPLRSFSEMPSVNWREAADNWFGSCCCSFGGISEKIAFSYANLYKCKEGACLLDTTSVFICKKDVLGCEFADRDPNGENDSSLDTQGEDVLDEGILDSHNHHGTCCGNQGHEIYDVSGNRSFLCCTRDSPGTIRKNEVGEEAASDDLLCSSTAVPGCCNEIPVQDPDEKIRLRVASLSTKDSEKNMKLLENQRSFLSSFLGNIFMARSSNISKEVDWTEFVCPQCSFLLGAYSLVNGNASSDGGVQLFKCNISTCSAVGGSDDVFRKYTLERMFANQLLESAKDELTFRTVVSDLKTKDPMIQLVLLNADSWFCSGYCLRAGDSIVSNSEIMMKQVFRPVIKVIFSECTNSTGSQSSLMQEWVSKNLADEVYMFGHHISELVASLDAARETYPPSFVFQRGLRLSHIQR